MTQAPHMVNMLTAFIAVINTIGAAFSIASAVKRRRNNGEHRMADAPSVPSRVP
jgi:hypothetical protein